MQHHLAGAVLAGLGPVAEGRSAERFHLESIGEDETELEEARSRDFDPEFDGEDDAFSPNDRTWRLVTRTRGRRD